MDAGSLRSCRQCGVRGARGAFQAAQPLRHAARGLARPTPAQQLVLRRGDVSVRAEGDSDAEFEDKLTLLRKAQGKTPYGQSRKEAKAEPAKEKRAAPQQPKYDFSGETLHFESPPHRGDLATNLALGTTLLWLPLTIAAIGRAAFINYRFTDRRLSVITSAPWKSEQLDAPYQEVKEVVTVGRGIGLWGDMVVTLRNGDKVELRSVPKFLELKKYILERRDELLKQGPSARAAPAGAASRSSSPAKKGFS